MKSILIIFTSIVLATNLNAQSLFEMDNIAIIEIYFPVDNWNQLMIDNYETEEYLIADSAVFNGSMKDSVGVRYKGNSTFSEINDKNPINISIDYINFKLWISKTFIDSA